MEDLSERERALLLAALRRAALTPDVMYDYLPESAEKEFPHMGDVAAAYSSLSEKLGLGRLPA